jgi:hypothetical protein
MFGLRFADILFFLSQDFIPLCLVEKGRSLWMT